MKNPVSLLLIVCSLFLVFDVLGQDKKVAVTTFHMNKKVQPGDLGYSPDQFLTLGPFLPKISKECSIPVK